MRGNLMDRTYWLKRERDAIANGRAATLADVKLIHYGLAARYSIEATNAGNGPRKFKGRVGEQLTTAFQV
jgi:hypothetical protein